MDDRPRRLLERPLVRGLVAAALLAVAAIAFFALRQGGDDAGGADSPLEARGALDGQAPIRGEAAPDFELRTVDGELMKLSDLRGKVVWVNFWATWCTPCRKELPQIQKLYDEKRDQGLVVLEVNYDEGGSQAADYWRNIDLSLPLLLDSDGSVYDQYKLQGLPDSFFVDRDGNLAALQYGFLNEQQARERLAAAGLE